MDIKLQEALNKQDAYLFSWGHLDDVPVGDETFNELSRDILAAFKACYGTAYLGILVFSWADQQKMETGGLSIYSEYTGQHIPAFGCNFVVPKQDAQLERMVKEWAIDEWPPKFDLFTKILQRIKALNGLILNWR